MSTPTRPQWNFNVVQSGGQDGLGVFATVWAAFLAHIALGTTTDAAGNPVLTIGAAKTPEGDQVATPPITMNCGTGVISFNNTPISIP